MTQSGAKVKTMYDWAPGRRGDLLMPDGSNSIQQSVLITSAGDVLEKLYREGRLKGQALADAAAKLADELQAYGESE